MAQVGAFQSATSCQILVPVKWLVIQRCISAGHEVEEGGQELDATARQRRRKAKTMKRVKGDQAQDAQRRFGRGADEERQFAQKTRNRDQAGRNSSVSHAEILLRLALLRHNTTRLRAGI